MYLPHARKCLALPYSSEPHGKHTFAVEEVFQLNNGDRPVDCVDVVSLLLQFLRRVLLREVDVALVVVVEFEQLLVGRLVQESVVIQFQKAATAMCA